ncbi:hypothetical protein D9613_000987 [Agrocybe pediades]|uniref:Uncharacterized protein n=1 Tax=Agrocybe pediades TaxID=84607 RepID=A0A8H4QZQ9_9AGAR|nr:hypothetical protein D9613_000987 [Agrocybe pediades]
MSATGPVPNSDVGSPLAFLPPLVAREIATATYIHIGATAVLVWDFANNIRNDYRILFHCKIGLQTCAYILTKCIAKAFHPEIADQLRRHFTGGQQYEADRFTSASPIADCAKFEAVMNGLLTACVALTTLTFYLRIYAIYRDNLVVKVVYGILWLATVGISVTFNMTFTAEHLGPTNYCLEGVKNHFLLPLAIVILTNDILIYVAITYRLYNLFYDIESSTGQKLKLLLGTSLPAFSKAVLQDSQLYFLMIVATKAFLVYTVHSLKPPMSVMYIICHLVLVNILSGRIFRTVKMNSDRWERPLSAVIGAGGGGMDFAPHSSFAAAQTRSAHGFPSSEFTGSQGTNTNIDNSEKGIHITNMALRPGY